MQHRRDVVVRRTRFELRKAEEKAHILEGLKVALDHLDADHHPHTELEDAGGGAERPHDADFTL
ncbi:MAG: hypothetical protein MZV70_59215 [Desulfobacterales bacterium]|nr:hypothetical protein [Desulfobacterales bacterium]